MNGVTAKQNFKVIRNSSSVTMDVVSKLINDCDSNILALAEETITNPLKNDKHSVYWTFDNGYTNAVLELQKNGISINDLTTNTLGTPFLLDFYHTIYDEKAIGYLIDWQKVLTIFGIGTYQIKCTATLIDSTTQVFYSFKFNLKKYTEILADGTVYLKFIKNGNEGKVDNKARKLDFGTLNYEGGMRLQNSFFGKPTSELTKEYAKRQNGEQIWIKDEKEIQYTLNLTAVPLALITYIDLYANVNSEMHITDYNSINSGLFSQLAVTSISGTTPKYTDGSILVSAEFKYKDLINNYIHNR